MRIARMIGWTAISVACGTLGCGADSQQEDDSTPILTDEVTTELPPTDAEIGAAREALSQPVALQDGFGVLQGVTDNVYFSSVPCYQAAAGAPGSGTKWGSSTCLVPTGKSVNLAWKGSDYTISFGGQSTSAKELFENACLQAFNTLASKGWQFHCETTGAGYSATVSACTGAGCTVPPSSCNGSFVLGSSGVTGFGNSWTLNGHTGKYVTGATTGMQMASFEKMWSCGLPGLTPGTPLTFAQRVNDFQNSVFHEIMHDIMLAHNVDTSNVMYYNQQAIFSRQILNLNAGQLSTLFAYQPGF